MSGYVDLTVNEIVELTEYAIHAEPSEERTRKVARLGRCLLWHDVARLHGADHADAIPDEFWETLYDRYSKRMDEEVLYGAGEGRPVGILGDDRMFARGIDS